MNATLLPRRAGLAFAVAAAVIFPIHAGSAAQVEAAQGKPLSQVPEFVVDTPAATALDLMLFVHRADLPLRPLPSKQKDNS